MAFRQGWKIINQMFSTISGMMINTNFAFFVAPFVFGIGIRLGHLLKAGLLLEGGGEVPNSLEKRHSKGGRGDYSAPVELDPMSYKTLKPNTGIPEKIYALSNVTLRSNLLDCLSFQDASFP